MLATLSLAAAAPAERQFDVVIYGGTAGGIVSAVAAAQEGASVIVIEPARHIGGMVTGGLGWTDIGNQQSIGGISRDFYRRIYAHYEQPEAWKFETREEFLKRMPRMVDHADRVWWAVEPSAASRVLGRLAADAKVTVLTGQPLKAVRKSGSRIEALTTAGGEVFRGNPSRKSSFLSVGKLAKISG